VESGGGSGDVRAQAKLMIKRHNKAIKDKDEALMAGLHHQHRQDETVKRSLVCVCQPDVFLREGRCMCGYETMLSEEMRKIHSQVHVCSLPPCT
jgi:hypothetical protein